MANIPDPNYDCMQSEFYSVAETMIGNLDTNLAKFKAYKGKYIAQMITDLEQELADAQALPDDDVRSGKGEQLRVQLEVLNTKCLNNQQDLKGYIDIFPEAERESQYGIAGMTNYRKAANKNCEFTKTMVGNGNDFILNNTVVLSDVVAGVNQNMPDTFPTQYKNDAKAFTDKYAEFKLATTTGVGTQSKILANNALNDKLSDIHNDSLKACRGDAGLLNLFVFDTVLKMVSPPGSSSLNINVVLDETGAAGTGAVFTYQKQNDPVLHTLNIDATGKIKLVSFDPGKYKWTCTLAGRIVAGGIKEVETGVDAKLEVRLKLV